MAPQQPMPLQFGAVPVSTSVQPAQTGDGGRVLVAFQTPLGIQGYLLSPEHARQLAQELDAVSVTAGTGLIIANGQVPREAG